MTSNITKKISDLDLDSLTFTDLRVNKQVKGLKTAFLTNSPIYIQFPTIELSSYGFPKIDQFHETDEKRDYLKIPLDFSTYKISYDMLVALDNKLSSDDFKKTMFGDKWEKMDYSPVIKYPEGKPPYVKLKLDLSYPEKEVQTVVMVNQEYVAIDCIEDFAKAVSYQSKVVCIVKIVKLWAIASGKYGLTIKLSKVKVDKKTLVKPVSDFLDEDWD